MTIYKKHEPELVYGNDLIVIYQSYGTKEKLILSRKFMYLMIMSKEYLDIQSTIQISLLSSYLE